MAETAVSLLTQYRFQANANRVVNARVVRLIESHPDVLFRQVVGYFKSINEILSHIYVADSFWIADIAFSAELPLRSGIDTVNIPQYETFRFADIAHIKELRSALDERLIRLAAELRESDLAKNVTDFEHPGEGVHKPVWMSVAHLFNHQTHHRGQLSAALDSFGVEHSFSTIIDIE